MNKIKNKKILLSFLKQNYDLSNPNIKRKYFHIQCVANNAYKIAESLKLSKEKTNLLYIIGLLHDIGRFEQWKLYETYNDYESVDHALLGIKILFYDKIINHLDIPISNYQIIKTSIMEHNKTSIDINNLSENEILYSKILRDADKIDGFKLTSKGKIPLFTPKEGVSIETLDSIKSKQPPSKNNIKTKLDRLLLFCANVYDLNFVYSYKVIKKMKYFKKMKKSAKFLLNNEDFQIFKKTLEQIELDFNLDLINMQK